MLLASNGITPPKIWSHKPELSNCNGDTVAILLAMNKKIPNKIWYHDPDISNKNDLTVAKILIKKCIKVPKRW